MTHRLLLAALGLFGGLSQAAEPAPQPLTRVIYQDHADSSLKWADVLIDSKGTVSLSSSTQVDGMPKLDDKQRFVMMKAVDSSLVVGIRDTENGEHASGWLFVNTGVRKTDHGDHAHWSFKRKPSIWDSVIDKTQGNPAHVYQYDQCIWIANDAKNGYTKIDPSKWSRTAGGQAIKGQAQFFPGGAKHITMATVAGKVGYGTWVDGGGPDAGRVDVTNLTTGQIAYSFKTPTGGLHGATACEGKVFLAPVDGICWVTADVNCSSKPADVKVNHLSLGQDGDKPRRTGGFQTLGHHVFCTTGQGDQADLIVIDAKASTPSPTIVRLSGKAGHKPASVLPVLVQGKVPHVVLFHDRNKDADITEMLDIVALDPNGDGQYSDAKVVKSIPVGQSAVAGHAGHHEACTDSDGRFLIFTNPGDGSISVYSFKSGAIVATSTVGGKPTSIVAHGGQDGED